MKQILQENQLPSTGFVVTRNQNAVVTHARDVTSSAEPIYENIPLPWQNTNSQMRARTQSIQSAPEISQVINHTLVNNLKSPSSPQPSNSTQGSKETLYANIDRTISTPTVTAGANSAKSSRTDLNVHSSTPNTSANVNESLNLNSSDAMPAMTRMSTFTVKNVTANSSNVSSLYPESENVTGETFTDASSSSSSGVGKKKRRWGILMGRSKSSEKVKSATLGREKEKNKDKNQSYNRHRWSTGLPRLHPLPPSISKETMVIFTT